MTQEMQFKKIIAQYCDVKPEEMTNDMKFREDLGFSSLSSKISRINISYYTSAHTYCDHILIFSDYTVSCCNRSNRSSASTIVNTCRIWCKYL